MTLKTDLSRSPYFDDYQVSKNFYRVLYRPGVAVQTRELNQMQSILQDQISKFGRHVFKDGSVVEGCAFSFDPKYAYVKIKDNYANGTAFTIADFVGKKVYNANGLEALIVNAVPGFESQDPDLNTLYIKYNNSATYPNGAVQSMFGTNENLVIATTANVSVGNVTSSAVANSTGYGYSFTTTEGVTFHKGVFIRVKPQTLVVSKYNNSPNGVSVGFFTNELLVTPNEDTSLVDNAAGAPNYKAPGAHRLKLDVDLVVRPIGYSSNTEPFFSLVDFKAGKPISIKNDPQYAALGNEMARRTYEESGNYVVEPFVISAEEKDPGDVNRATKLNIAVSKGLGYIEGFRVEYINANLVDIRKGIDYNTVQSQIVGTNFGYYVNAKEFVGEFNSDTIAQVELHSAAKTALTSRTWLSTSVGSSTKIGTAYVRGSAYNTGIPGTPDATYKIYLFNITMNPGQSFSSVRSIAYKSGATLYGVADIVTELDGSAKIQEPINATMVYPFGQRAIKSNGFNNVAFTYRNKSTGQFQAANGTMTITLASPVGTGNETNPYSGTLSDGEDADFIIIATSNTTSSKTGTVTVTGTNNIVVGSATAFASDYAIGDYINVGGSNVRRVTAIANNTYLTVDANLSAASANTHAKQFYAGMEVPFVGRTNRSITATGSVLTFNLIDTLASPLQATVYHNVRRSSTKAIGKVINKNRFVKIDCSNNAGGSAGPWNLGLPDVLKIRSVYIGSNSIYSNTGTNYVDSFVVDNGQRDSHYDLARISIRSNASVRLTSSSTILVELDHFTYDQSQGVGFFTANSYPIDDVNTSNTSAITTQEIPLFTSSITGGTFDLRDCVDFRPFASNTAASATTVGAATINPAAVLSFNILPSGSYLPAPDNQFETDLQYYLPRKDRISISTSGELIVSEGIAAETPRVPLEKPGMMSLGVVDVAPYPSLSPIEARSSNRFDYTVTAKIGQNRRWTMRDINILSNRIDNLEYYTSLSLLEKSASDLLVRSDTTGQNRFKNGFLVDSFAGHDIGNTRHPKYYISIDSVKTEMRPGFAQYRLEMTFDPEESTGVTKRGDLVLLNHVDVAYQNQPYASKYRNCIEGNIYQWKGNIDLTPSGSTEPDLTYSPAVINNLDLASNWLNLDNAWGTQWGNWNTLSSQTTTALGNNIYTLSDVTNEDGSRDLTYLTNQVTTTTTRQQRSGIDLSTYTTQNQYNLGTFVTDVSLLPYIKSIAIKFAAVGLKPNTKVYAYFDDVPVSGWVSQTDSSYANPVPWGTQIVTDAYGRAFGYFVIPPNTFKSQELIFKLTDINDLTIGRDAATTEATGTFYGSNISIAKGSSVLRTREAVVNYSEVRDFQTITDVDRTVTTTRQYIPAPPPPPQQYHGCGCGSIICTKLYEMGLMDENIYKADEAFGHFLRETDPEVYEGYLAWAQNVVRWLDGDTPDVMFWIRDPEKRREVEQYLTTKITYTIATPWAEHMAYLMGYREKDNLAGKIIMGIGKPISRLVNKLIKKESLDSKVSSYSMIALFILLYYISKTFGGNRNLSPITNK